jgi:hypothetical protein
MTTASPTERSSCTGLLNAHAFLQVERPPTLWENACSLDAFVPLLGELIAAALVRNGGRLSEVFER